MIPLLAAMTFPPVTGTPAGTLALEFAGGLTVAAMGVGDSIGLSATWDGNGEEADSISFQVQTGVDEPTQWVQKDFTATDSTVQGDTYSSADDGWIGAGTYQFFAIARRTGTGAYDVVSNVITLVVS